MAFVNLDSLVYTKLKVSAITNLVGANLYPVEPEQELAKMPYIVFTVNYGEAWPGIDKVYYGSLDNTIIVDCRDVHLDTCKGLASAVYNLLHGWRDMANGVQICRLVNSDKDMQSEYYRITMTFKLVV